MRRDLMDLIVCPLCKRELALEVESEQEGEIVSGTLACGGCGEVYPIEDAIPVLLPPDLR